MKNLDSHLEDIVDNINNDRAMALTLLTDLMSFLKTDHAKHQYSGPVAAKYLETLQRSNEQLVKVATLMHKKTASFKGLTKDDKDSLYDLINQESDE